MFPKLSKSTFSYSNSSPGLCATLYRWSKHCGGWYRLGKSQVAMTWRWNPPRWEISGSWCGQWQILENVCRFCYNQFLQAKGQLSLIYNPLWNRSLPQRYHFNELKELPFLLLFDEVTTSQIKETVWWLCNLPFSSILVQLYQFIWERFLLGNTMLMIYCVIWMKSWRNSNCH